MPGTADRRADPSDRFRRQVLRAGDAYARVSAAGDRCFTPGEFRVDVPGRKGELTSVKGFEYGPRAYRVEISPNEVTTVAVALKRLTDMSAKGWHSGSTHVHMNYGGNLHNTLENLMMMSAAEDQDIVLEQIANKDNRILDHQFFVPGGGPHPLSRDDMAARRRPGIPSAVLGACVHVRHEGSPDLAVHDGLRRHRDREPLPEQHRHVPQGEGTGRDVGYVHAFGGEARSARRPISAAAKGSMVDAALGTTDAIEWSAAGRTGFFPLYASGTTA